jgi:hypothetical protein
MMSSKTRPTDGMTKNVADQPARKKAMVAVPAFLLATIFTFAAAPTATAAPAVVHRSIASAADPDQCRRGEAPGVCLPYSAGQQQSVQNNTMSNQHFSPHQSPMQNQHVTPQRSSSP